MRDAARSDYERARRKAFRRRLLSWFTRQDNALLAFDEIRKGLHAQAQHEGGVRAVPIDQIVGSVGRYRDFDRAFLPRQVKTRDRWESVDLAQLEGTELPPIELYKIGETYFVKDGNHRVSVARERGQKFIDAHVIEVEAPAPVMNVEDLLEWIRKQEALAFYETTRLGEIRPGARIDLTLPGQYEKLLEHIQVHRWFLGEERGSSVDWSDAVESWYDRVYSPLIEAVHASGVLGDFPGRSPADLYVWLIEHRWYQEQAGSLEPDAPMHAVAREYAAAYSPRLLRRLARLLGRSA